MSKDTHNPRRHVWPLFIAGGVILGIVLAYVWVKFEVDRTRDRTGPFHGQTPTPTNLSSASTTVERNAP